ncbi:MAG TPA: manganese catalase family protein [Candidatus Evtepia faecavium]|nr:manganese catalase family protein [Candidatus Evtepia faecavium]
MFVYQKKLQYPVRIKNTNPKLASLIISQYGGPEWERVRHNDFLRFVKKIFIFLYGLFISSSFRQKIPLLYWGA